MTALERKWKQSRWRPFRGLSLVCRRSPNGWSSHYEMEVWKCPNDGTLAGNLHWFAKDPVMGPDVATLAEAKADAESMYRQWVYDEYGVVLP